MLGARRSGAEIAGKGTGGRGVGEIKGEAEADAGEQDAGTKLRDGEHITHNLYGLLRLRGEVGVHLVEELVHLGVELAGGVEDEAFEDETDGVQRRGNDEDEEPGEEAEARAEAGGDACLAEAGAIHAEHNDGC